MQPDTQAIVPRTDPLVIIADAIKSGMDPEKLGKLMDLSERWAKDRAAEKFANAITAFQRECPQIHRSKNVEAKYDYAPYESIMAVAGPIMVRHGIVATFSYGEPNEHGIAITCRIRVGVHQETTTLTMPIPAGNKLVNASQLMGQATSYGRRYALSAALNIVTTNEDNDAAGCLDTLIRSEVEDLAAAMEEKGMPLQAFLRFAQAESLDVIPRNKFAHYLAAIKRSKKKETAQ